MRASEAAAISQEALAGEASAEVMAHVLAGIREAAKAGQYELAHPFHGLKGSARPRSNVKEAVFAKLRADGFTVEHKPDPDPGHPASGPHDVISWSRRERHPRRGPDGS